jgi:CMP-N-acetylneuraminic acid synthetase
MTKKILAIIPSRGDSKRLPGKNILDLAGKPLIAWTIEAALGSKYIDHIMVSTDNNNIAQVAKKYGADVPFMRPHELATDESTSIDTVLHVIKNFEENGDYYDYIVLLQPTSPLRSSHNIDESIELLQTRECNAVISVCEAEHNPLWCNILPDNGSLSNFLDSSVLNKRSQDLERYYRLNGAIYLCDTEKLKKEKTFFLRDNCVAYKMSRDNSIDIDEEIDFRLAELYATRLL